MKTDIIIKELKRCSMTRKDALKKLKQIERESAGDLISRKAINENLRKYNLVGGITTVALEDINKMPAESFPKLERLYTWLCDMRLGIAPDETTPEDERGERQAQVDVLDDIMAWIIKEGQ